MLEYVQNLAANRRLSEAAASPPKGGAVPRASNTSPKVPSSKRVVERENEEAPALVEVREEKEEAVDSTGKMKAADSAKSTSSANIANMTPLQRKQLREKSKIPEEEKTKAKEKERTPEKKLPWGGASPSAAASTPSLSEIMKEHEKGGNRSDRKRGQSKNFTKKSPSKPAWSMPHPSPESAPSPLSFAEIQRQERETSIARTPPRAIPQAKTTSPPSVQLSRSPSSPSASPQSSSAPVVHRHMWGSRSSLPSTPAPTLAESSRRLHFQSKPIDLRDVMSEQYIEQILADDQATQS